MYAFNSSFSSQSIERSIFHVLLICAHMNGNPSGAAGGTACQAFLPQSTGLLPWIQSFGSYKSVVCHKALQHLNILAGPLCAGRCVRQLDLQGLLIFERPGIQKAQNHLDWLLELEIIHQKLLAVSGRSSRWHYGALCCCFYSSLTVCGSRDRDPRN